MIVLRVCFIFILNLVIFSHGDMEMSIMTVEDLEEALEPLFPNGFQIETNDDGQLVILTGLAENDDGELVSLDQSDDNSDSDDDTEVYDESDDFE